MSMLPTLFLSHGSPMLALQDSPARRFLLSLAASLPRPTAIVMVSAHWETRNAPAVSLAVAPETIHDFGGFPQALYDIRYQAPGAPEVAERVAALFAEAGIPVGRNAQRGLDHGAWVPLSLMYPDADLPVMQISLVHGAGPAAHAQLGQALASLRGEGVLVIGSGSLTHNLYEFHGQAVDAAAPSWVLDFEGWMRERLESSDIAALLDYRAQAPFAERNHPSEEHLLPLFVAMGAAGEGAARNYCTRASNTACWRWMPTPSIKRDENVMNDTANTVLTEPSSGLIYRVQAARSGQARAPCLILLHGVGANEAGFIELARMMDPRLAVVLPRGPLEFGPTQYGWFQVSFTPTGPVPNLAQAELSRQKLIGFVERLPQLQDIDPARIFIAGFSQGGIMSASVALTAPDKVAGFAILSGRILPEVLPAVQPRAELAALRAFISHGVQDQKLGIHFAHHAKQVLEALGVPLEYHEYMAGHSLEMSMVADFRHWLGAHLGV